MYIVCRQITYFTLFPGSGRAIPQNHKHIQSLDSTSLQDFSRQKPANDSGLFACIHYGQGVYAKMSRSVLYRKGDFMVVQNGGGRSLYYTIINTVDGSHTHVRGRNGGSNIKTAKIVCAKAHVGDIKKNYPYFMKLSIFRVLNKHDQIRFIDMIKPLDAQKYFKGTERDLKVA